MMVVGNIVILVHAPSILLHVLLLLLLLLQVVLLAAAAAVTADSSVLLSITKKIINVIHHYSALSHLSIYFYMLVGWFMFVCMFVRTLVSLLPDLDLSLSAALLLLLPGGYSAPTPSAPAPPGTCLVLSRCRRPPDSWSAPASRSLGRGGALKQHISEWFKIGKILHIS